MRTALIIVSTLGLTACNIAAEAQKNAAQEAEAIAGDSQAARRDYAVAAFDSVSLGGPHNVIVQVGPAASVRAEGPAEDLDRLEIKVEDGDLNIGTRKDRKWPVRIRHGGHPVTIYVTTPSLAAASIGGSGDMRIDTVEGKVFAASIGGSGDMDIAALRVDDASFSIAGSGAIKAVGTAGKTDVSVAGSGDVDVAGLESRTASVSIVGSGDVQTRAMDTADVSIMGPGDVTVTGSAKCSISKMGSGDVRCGG